MLREWPRQCRARRVPEVSRGEVSSCLGDPVLPPEKEATEYRMMVGSQFFLEFRIGLEIAWHHHKRHVASERNMRREGKPNRYVG